MRTIEKCRVNFPRPLVRQRAFLNLLPIDSAEFVAKSLKESFCLKEQRKNFLRQEGTTNLLLTSDYLEKLEESYSTSSNSSSTSCSPKSTPRTPRHSEILTKFLAEGVSEKPEVVINCSLMEYETKINRDSELEVLVFLKKLSDELYSRLGGVVCPSDTNFVQENNGFRLKVKWVMPMSAFQKDEDLDPQEIAFWLLENLPPIDSSSMGSMKGIFQDVDLSILRRLMREAIKFYLPG